MLSKLNNKTKLIQGERGRQAKDRLISTRIPTEMD